ncbi:kin of IRRE-like protein 2 [Halyomorpha halys]|uniref:kin of IRRE-like protein 2 n=1 Tax=Halyomorpha halys TaxID=286706 RepID=UPI0006D4D86E
MARRTTSYPPGIDLCLPWDLLDLRPAVDRQRIGKAPGLDAWTLQSSGTYIEEELFEIFNEWIRCYMDGMPHFTTEGRHFKVVEHDSITLPCRVVNIGNHIRAWKRGIAVLTAGNVKVSPDDRYSLIHGYDLEIRSITPQDEGEYICQIATLQPQEITHTLEVLVPPRILEVSGGGLVEARKGTPVTIECRATGNPPPFFQWTRRALTRVRGHVIVENISLFVAAKFIVVCF